jgi:hypothetical protein
MFCEGTQHSCVFVQRLSYSNDHVKDLTETSQIQACFVRARVCNSETPNKTFPELLLHVEFFSLWEFYLSSDYNTVFQLCNQSWNLMPLSSLSNRRLFYIILCSLQPLSSTIHALIDNNNSLYLVQLLRNTELWN